jgi:ribonuclease-3
MKNNLVKGSTLALIGKALGIEQYLKHKVKNIEGINKLLEDSFEAMIGAIYLDSKDFLTTEKVINNCYKLIDIQSILKNKHAKMVLQEYSQYLYKEKPIYYNISNQDHMIFTSEVLIPCGKKYSAQGRSYKEAETKCAELALIDLHVNY